MGWGVAPYIPNELYSMVGDVNFDGIINIQDLVLIINEILTTGTGGEGTFSDLQFSQGDINQDGVLDILDIVSIVNMIMED